MSLFNSITQARLKDYFVDVNGLPVFVVQQSEIGKAVGKKGANVRLLEDKLNRKIKIIEFNPDMVKFAKNLVYPIKLENIEVEGKNLILTPVDKKSRGLLIGRAAKNLRNIENIIKRYFEIDEVKVI